MDSRRRRLETGFFGFRKKNCTIHVAKTKVLISLTVTGKLICAFVFTKAKIWFSRVAAQIIFGLKGKHENCALFQYLTESESEWHHLQNTAGSQAY